MPITLKLKKEPELYLETDSITPDQFAGKSTKDIQDLTVFLANREMKLGDFFDVSGKSGNNAEETSINIEGNCNLVQRIGEKMTNGDITIKGNCGMHLGNTMTGGKITVEGNAAEWCGSMMEGGEILVKGDAGNHCASAYRGNWIGMKGGKIKVLGRVGVESGSWMRNSKTNNLWPILECGSADYYLGVHNHGGTIICEGDAEGRIGADMARGQIVVKGKIKKKILSSFRKVGDIKEIKSPAGVVKGQFIEYEGDCAVNAKKAQGRLYIAK